MTDEQNDDTQITIIVPARGGAAAPQAVKLRKADKGGVEDSMLDDFFGFFKIHMKPIEDMEGEMTKIVRHVGTIIAAIKSSPLGEMELSSVDIGLAVNAEGTIGIASAGVETSMTLSFTNSKRGN